MHGGKHKDEESKQKKKGGKGKKHQDSEDEQDNVAMTLKKGKAARNKQATVAIEDEVDEEWELEKMGGKKTRIRASDITLHN